MIIFWISISVILYVFILYPLILALFNRILIQESDHSIRNEITNHPLPVVTILVCTFNEQERIRRRLDNLLQSDYPEDKMEIIAASDGSTDRTVEIAKTYESRLVKIMEFKLNRGKASVQNDGVREARGEIVVFTDAETMFERNSVRNLAAYFGDPSTGCVVGNLVYSAHESSISESEEVYWGYEKRIRSNESDLGILSTATGAIMAVRKSLWRELTPIDDSDFTTPLDVVLQGSRVVYAPEAVAYDVPPRSIKGELKARIRQTSKNLIGTLNRWGWEGWLKHPLVSWSLLSHKILRWLIPFFMVSAFVSNFFLYGQGFIYSVSFLAQSAFYTLALVGLTGELFKTRIPVVSMALSFCVANVGMGIGVIRGIMGKAPAAYKTTE